MREERVVKGHAFHPSAVWGKERKDLARLEYHTCPACRISNADMSNDWGPSKFTSPLNLSSWQRKVKDVLLSPLSCLQVFY